MLEPLGLAAPSGLGCPRTDHDAFVSECLILSSKSQSSESPAGQPEKGNSPQSRRRPAQAIARWQGLGQLEDPSPILMDSSLSAVGSTGQHSSPFLISVLEAVIRFRPIQYIILR